MNDFDENEGKGYRSNVENKEDMDEIKTRKT